MQQHRNKVEVSSFARIVKEYYPEGDIEVILDIGSRYGNESIALKRAFSNSKVYAFECNPDAIKVWKDNVKEKEIYLVEKAVSEVDGPVDFYAINPDKTLTPHEDGNIGASSLFNANPEYPYEKYFQDRITVESTTIHKWAINNNIKEIDLVWLDVQGAELKVLRSMKELIQTVKLIHTEVSFRPVYIGQPLFKDINSFLKEENFLFIGFENVSGWFGDANYVNANYLNHLRKWRCRGKQLLNLIVDFKHHKRRLRQYFN